MAQVNLEIVLLRRFSHGFRRDVAPEAVFADLSLSLDTAWRTGLIARNGRGKTTLLRLLSGDLQGKGKIEAIPHKERTAKMS